MDLCRGRPDTRLRLFICRIALFVHCLDVRLLIRSLPCDGAAFVWLRFVCGLPATGRRQQDGSGVSLLYGRNVVPCLSQP